MSFDMARISRRSLDGLPEVLPLVAIIHLDENAFVSRLFDQRLVRLRVTSAANYSAVNYKFKRVDAGFPPLRGFAARNFPRSMLGSRAMRRTTRDSIRPFNSGEG